MGLDLSRDLRTVTELKRDPREVINHARETKRPVVVTINGKAGAVLLDVETYQRKLAALNLAPLVADAERSVRAGRVKPIKDVFNNLRKHVQEVSSSRVRPR